MDTVRQANAAQVKYSPGPAVVIMPCGTVDPLEVIVTLFIDAAFEMITVHNEAPTRSRKLPKTESDDESRKATVCFKTPLRGGLVSYMTRSRDALT